MEKEILNINKSSFQQLVRKYPVRLLILFGSSVDGRRREGSDIDIGIYLEKKIGEKKETKLIEDLVHTLKIDSLDPVILNFASPILLFEVIKKSKLLYEKKEDDFLQFKLLAMKKYWEFYKFQKYRKLYLHRKERDLNFV